MDQEIREVQDNPIEEISMEDEVVEDVVNSRKDIVGDFLASEVAEELVLILVEGNEGGTLKELEIPAERRDVASSLIHQIKPRRRKKKRPRQVREKNKKRQRRIQIVKAGIG